jgi:alginate O-acetyltransferase complex protein AlgI
MLIGGLWHGANWNFILWGFLHGSYQIVEHLFSHLEIKLTLPVRLKQFLIFSLVTVTWTTFMFASPTDIVKVLSGLLHLTTPFAWLHIKKELVYSLPSFIGAILLVIFFTEEQVDRIPYSLKASLLLSVLFIFIVATKLLENRVPFFYFQF